MGPFFNQPLISFCGFNRARIENLYCMPKINKQAKLAGFPSPAGRFSTFPRLGRIPFLPISSYSINQPDISPGQQLPASLLSPTGDFVHQRLGAGLRAVLAGARNRIMWRKRAWRAGKTSRQEAISSDCRRQNHQIETASISRRPIYQGPVTGSTSLIEAGAAPSVCPKKPIFKASSRKPSSKGAGSLIPGPLPNKRRNQKPNRDEGLGHGKRALLITPTLFPALWTGLNC